MPRVKPHFKTHLSFGNHRKTASVFSDNDLFATWSRLGMLAVERRAARTSDIFVVRNEELPALTGTKRGDSALRVWNKLLSSSTLVAEYSPPIWTVHFPKFAEKQGFGLGKEPPPNTEYLDKRTLPTEASSDADQQTALIDGGETPTNSRGSRESDEVESTGPETRAAAVAREWSACVSAAATYGKRWSPQPSARRVTMLVARLRDFPSANPDVLVRAIHGAVRSWNRDEESIAKWLRPETVYRRANFEKYIEASNEPDIPVTQRRDQNARREDNTVSGALSRLADHYGIGPEGDRSETIDVRSSVQRVPDE